MSLLSSLSLYLSSYKDRHKDWHIWICIVEHRQKKSYLHFVHIGWSLFLRSQQHSHKDSNDEEGEDSSNYSSSYGYGRGLLKWNICKVTKIRLSNNFKEFLNLYTLISTCARTLWLKYGIQQQTLGTPNLIHYCNIMLTPSLLLRRHLSIPALPFSSYKKNIPS